MDQNSLYTHSNYPRQRSPTMPTGRHHAAYQNSSAYSASANPDEDWTQVSDLAERRRIQNRIAQRNYRKKLKRRLEDLEKRTSSSSVSPEQTPQEIVNISSDTLSVSSRGQARRSSSQGSRVSHEANCPSDVFPQEETWPDMRQPPTTSFSYTLPAPTVYSQETYQASSGYYAGSECPITDYPPTQPLYSTSQYQQSYPPAASPPLPLMNPYESSKQNPQYGTPEIFTPYDMNYSSLGGMNLSNPKPGEDFGLRTPALTDSMSYFSSSRECSPFYFEQSLSPEIPANSSQNLWGR